MAKVDQYEEAYKLFANSEQTLAEQQPPMTYLLFVVYMHGVQNVLALKTLTLPASLPLSLIRQAALITVGEPDVVIKDRFGIFDSTPPSTVEEIMNYLADLNVKL